MALESLVLSDKGSAHILCAKSLRFNCSFYDSIPVSDFLMHWIVSKVFFNFYIYCSLFQNIQ